MLSATGERGHYPFLWGCFPQSGLQLGDPSVCSPRAELLAIGQGACSCVSALTPSYKATLVREAERSPHIGLMWTGFFLSYLPVQRKALGLVGWLYSTSHTGFFQLISAPSSECHPSLWLRLGCCLVSFPACREDKKQVLHKGHYP